MAQSGQSPSHHPTSAHCDLCGADSGEELTPLTWSVAMEAGRVMKYCTDCTRNNVRAMEGKLDSQYW